MNLGHVCNVIICYMGTQGRAIKRRVLRAGYGRKVHNEQIDDHTRKQNEEQLHHGLITDSSRGKSRNARSVTVNPNYHDPPRGYQHYGKPREYSGHREGEYCIRHVDDFASTFRASPEVPDPVRCRSIMTQ